MNRSALATPFGKLLIANRGEIARRIQRSACALGYRTVAVHSTADAGALHVRESDQAVCIGGPRPAESYLNIEALIAAARRTGADAVHPGYGFLAENAAFARACRDAGLVFVGPSPEAIAAMGDKAGAKARMMAAGVPCIPGYQGDDQGDARLLAEAERIGWPVMIKATAGGGGRGMRCVASAAEFPAALAAARSEALAAFGRADVLLERALLAPRHVEVQVFADRHGHAIQLGERDCSVQRRHQKLIEEAPCPAVDAALRERLGAAALQAVAALADLGGYEGAGTVEFLLDADGNFYFMEMNTRLQVEHPVTEAITGLDLVEWQLRVAAGEPLPRAQDEVRFDGHAIEVRLCAEDPAQGFLPQSGTLAQWRPGAGLRVEHALADGQAMPPFYDSMIAKLVARGATREEARRRLRHGLQDTRALGLRTNQAFLARCLAHPDFAAGAATTAFVDAHQAELLAADPAHAHAPALAALLLAETADRPAPGEAAWQLRHALPVGLHFTLDSVPQAATVTWEGPCAARVRTGDQAHDMALAGDRGADLRVTLDGVAEPVTCWREGARMWLHWRGRAFEVEDRTRAPAARPGAGAAGDGRVRASTSGRVVAVLATVGERVAAGQPLVTLEAMKMEHVHAAPVAGVVTALDVALGDQVAAGRPLVQIDTEVPGA